MTINAEYVERLKRDAIKDAIWREAMRGLVDAARHVERCREIFSTFPTDNKTLDLALLSVHEALRHFDGYRAEWRRS